MLSTLQIQMFARLGRGEPQFLDWLRAELGKAGNTLIHITNADQLRVAQGRAQMLLELIANMEECGDKTPG